MGITVRTMEHIMRIMPMLEELHIMPTMELPTILSSTLSNPARSSIILCTGNLHNFIHDRGMSNLFLWLNWDHIANQFSQI